MRRLLLHCLLSAVLLAGQAGVQLYSLDKGMHKVVEAGGIDLGSRHDESLAHAAGLCHLFQAVDCALSAHPAPLGGVGTLAMHSPWFLGEPRPFARFSRSPRAPPAFY